MLPWLELSWWYAQEARIKSWQPREPRTPKGVTNLEAYIVSRMTGAAALATLASPIITWFLYPWLPQPDMPLLVLYGLLMLGVAWVANEIAHGRDPRRPREEASCESPEGQ